MPAASATCCGASRRPAGSATAPAAMSSPASRRLAPAFRPGRQHHGGALHPAVLLHEHGIGPGRHRRAGEYADRRAGAERRRLPAGGDAVGDRKPRLAVRVEVGVAHRVAVDRRIVERRQAQRRDHVGGEHPARSHGRAEPPRSPGPAAPVRRSAAPPHRPACSGPENAKQSSDSWAIRSPRCAATARAARRAHQYIGDRVDVVEAHHRHAGRAATRRKRSRRSPGSSGASSGLPTAARWTSSLTCALALEPLDDDEIDRRQLGQQRRAAAPPARRAARAPAPSAAAEPTSTSVAPAMRCSWSPCRAGRCRTRGARA